MIIRTYLTDWQILISALSELELFAFFNGKDVVVKPSWIPTNPNVNLRQGIIFPYNVETTAYDIEYDYTEVMVRSNLCPYWVNRIKNEYFLEVFRRIIANFNHGLTIISRDIYGNICLEISTKKSMYYASIFAGRISFRSETCGLNQIQRLKSQLNLLMG